MAHNLKKFQTEADYQAAELNYPSVAWVVSGDTIHYDKTEPQPVVTEKVVLTFTTADGEGNVIFYNGEGADVDQITGLTFNGEPIDPIEPELFNVQLENVNVIEYAIEGTTIGDAFTGDLTETNASLLPSIEFLIPAFITEVAYLPNNRIDNLVIMASTPPEASVDTSAFTVSGAIYVPDDAVSAYQNTVWSGPGKTILPLSEYEGNLPVVVDNGGDESE